MFHFLLSLMREYTNACASDTAKVYAKNNATNFTGLFDGGFVSAVA
jgi:hypothetical protein